jgi:hypothetical protein
MPATELLDSTRKLLLRSSEVEADLLSHLAEIEQRKIHLDRGFTSMFVQFPAVPR